VICCTGGAVLLYFFFSLFERKFVGLLFYMLTKLELCFVYPLVGILFVFLEFWLIVDFVVLASF
jgi:hypothetical protein